MWKTLSGSLNDYFTESVNSHQVIETQKIKN